MTTTFTQIISPDAAYQESYEAYIKELAGEERYPFVMDLPHTDFEALLRRLDEIKQGINLPDGAVANLTFWLVSSNELIGVANLRPKLNPTIEHIGGHIGIGIRPSRRGQGWSRVLFQGVLQHAKKLRLKALSVHCYQDNDASRRMILANGGQLTSTVMLDNGQAIDRFDINLANVE